MTAGTLSHELPSIDSRRYVRGGLLVVAAAILYADVIGQLIEAWSTNYLYSYGFAVPLISAYMVWTKWPGLTRLAPVPQYRLGVPIVLLGVALLLAGALSSVTAAQQLSLIVTVTGLTLLLFGTAIFKEVWFPILYLLLMLPLWDQAINRLQIPSQLLSARIAVSMLTALHVPVAREATFIVLPGLTLEVLRECSGVNQLIVVFAMAVPAAYLFLKATWRRVALVVLAVAIAYLSNGFRIALIGVLAQHGYQEATRGTLHLVQGLIVSGVGYLAIGAILSWLARERSDDRSEPAEAAPEPAAVIRRQPWLEISVAVLLLVATAYRYTFNPVPVALVENLAMLPVQVGDWSLDPSALPASALPSMPAMDDEIVRNYRNPAGERLRLYVGYYRSQASGKELSNAAVRTLQVGARRLAAPSVGGDGHMRLQDVDGGGTLFWYDVNGRILDSVYAAKAYTLWDAITRGRTNTAVIVVQWQAVRGEDTRSSRDGAMDFVRGVLPALRRSLPL